MSQKSIVLPAAGLLVMMSQPLWAQTTRNVEWIESNKVIQEGFRHYEEENFDKAVEAFRKVHRNDSNFETAHYELSLAYMAAKKYEECVKTCKEGIARNSPNAHLYYVNYGSALDDLGRNDEAIKIYDEGIKKYPYMYRLYFNKAVTLRRMKRDAEAVEVFQKCISLNPMAASAHLHLGMLAAKNDKPTQAYLSIQTFLLLESNTERALSALQVMESLGNGAYQANPDSVVTFKGEGDDFSKIDKLIKSKMAIQSDYKCAIKTRIGVIKQAQLVLEKLSYNSSDKGFWMQYYVPMFLKIREEGVEKGLLTALLKPIPSSTEQKLVKKNASKISEMGNVVGTFISDRRKQGFYKTDFQYKGRFWYYDGGELAAIGEKSQVGKEQEPTGQWYYFYENGNLKAEGKFNDKGLKEGVWKNYYEDGKPKSSYPYSNGEVNGVAEDYEANGVIESRTTYKNGVKDGKAETFYANGQTQIVSTYKNGELAGPFVRYAPNGVKNLEGVFGKEGLEGEVKRYFQTGELSSVSQYKAGKENGLFKDYYVKGKLYAEGQVKDGNRTGLWKTYYADGKLKKEEMYSEKPEEQYSIEYHRDGKTVSEETRSTKEVATEKKYDKDGKLFCTTEYKNGKIIKLVYQDKTGKILSQTASNKGSMAVTAYWPNGTKRSEGTLKNGDLVGDWKYYNQYGGLDEINPRTEGKLNGVVKEYYTNGALSTETEYEENEMNGYRRTFYDNGKLKAEGFCRNGEMEGEWLEYFLDGTLSAKRYYIGGSQTGYQEYFFPNGKKAFVENYEYGFFAGMQSFDTSGRMLEEIKLVNGNGERRTYFPDGRSHLVGTFKQGYADGPFKYLFPNGRTEVEVTFKMGKREGLEKRYRPTGTIRNSFNWFHGEYDGECVWYDVAGNKELVSMYDLGETSGLREWYYENGKPEISGQRVNDEHHGYMSYFAPDGTLRYRLKYEYGVPVAYSYLDKTGKMLPDMPINNGTGKIDAYFQNGNLSAEVKFVNGVRDGEYRLYHTNGRLAYTSVQTAGNLNGKQAEYFADGKPKEEVTYKDDELNGTLRRYYPNGNLQAEENYYLGKKHGAFKYYDQTGKLKETYWYAYDEIIK